MRSILASFICSKVGLITYFPLMRATRTSEMRLNVKTQKQDSNKF